MAGMDIRVRVGLRIKELRADAGISQEALANVIGMSRSYLAEVEVGKRNITLLSLERIANGMGVSLESFFEGQLFDHPCGPGVRAWVEKADRVKG